MDKNQFLQNNLLHLIPKLVDFDKQYFLASQGNDFLVHDEILNYISRSRLRIMDSFLASMIRLRHNKKYKKQI